MGSTTPVYALPYPVGTDLIADGDNAIQALAERLENVFDSSFQAWMPYTPVWTAATTNPVQGGATVQGRYVRGGKWVHFAIRIGMASSTTYGSGGWRVSLPVAAHAFVLGSGFGGMLWDSSAGRRDPVFGDAVSATVLGLYVPTSPMVAVTGTAPFTWGDNDVMVLRGTYEAA